MRYWKSIADEDLFYLFFRETFTTREPASKRGSPSSVPDSTRANYTCKLTIPSRLAISRIFAHDIFIVIIFTCIRIRIYERRYRDYPRRRIFIFLISTGEKGNITIYNAHRRRGLVLTWKRCLRRNNDNIAGKKTCGGGSEWKARRIYIEKCDIKRDFARTRGRRSVMCRVIL